MSKEIRIILNIKRYIVHLAIVLLAGVPGEAQRSYQVGLLPSVNINKKLPRDFTLNLRLESRQELKNSLFNTASSFDYRYVLTDFSLLVAKKVSLTTSWALGYLIRVEDGEIVQRSIQQFTVTKSFSGLRLAHRFSTDQTFAQREKIEYRLRYRISAEIPLNGQSVDPGEFYVKINHEYLNSWQNRSYDLEIRAVPMLGFEFSDTKKLEIGLDYRLSSFLDSGSRQRFWIGVNWFQVF